MTSGAWKHPPRKTERGPRGAGLFIFGPLLGIAFWIIAAIIFHAVKAAIQYPI